MTGAAGFVGTHLVRRLRTEDHDVHALVLPQEELAPDLRDVPRHPCDVTDAAALEPVLRELAPEWIFHLAAISRPQECRDDPVLAWDVNFLGTHNVYHLAAQVVPETRVLFVSSAVVYGRPAEDDLPLTEDAPLRPGDVYATTKLAGDLLGAEFALSGRLSVIRVRPFNHVGPGQGEGFVAPDFAAQIARIEAGVQKPEMQVGNLSPARDFTDVRDVVRAYLLLMEKGDLGAVYNVCSETARTVQELLDGIRALSKTDLTVEVSSRRTRKDEPDRVFGCAEALRAATGWTPQISWEQTLRDVLDEWRAHTASVLP